MRLILYYSTSILTGVDDNGFLTFAPGADWCAREIGWHLYDQNPSNPLHNYEEVQRKLAEQAFQIGASTKITFTAVRNIGA